VDHLHERGVVETAEDECTERGALWHELVLATEI
jgi:hypothetical protein